MELGRVCGPMRFKKSLRAAAWRKMSKREMRRGEESWEEPCLKKFVWWMFWQLRGNGLKETRDATRTLVDSSLKTFEERVRDFALGILEIVRGRVECIHVS